MCQCLFGFLQAEFSRSTLAERRHQGGQQGSSVELTRPDGGKVTLKEKTSMDKMQRALRDADRMEREAAAADILEASCDYVAEHRVRQQCHVVIDENDEQLKAALMRPGTNVSQPVVDPEWLCRKVVAACGERERVVVDVPRWWHRFAASEGALFLTAGVVLAGFVFVQQRPWLALLAC